eukprot:1905050-Alexandrium_andersonii.AAC.1
MSASLVGSEMCIRDSRKPRGNARSGQESCPKKGLGPCAECLRCLPNVSCLLYTSDAADDM